MATYYKPSGKFSPLSFVLLILIAFTALPLLGFVYAYGIRYMPSIYICFLLTVLFGISIAYLTNWTVVKFGKVRSPILAVIFTILATLIALYFHWAIWIDIIYTGAALDLTVFELIIHPDFLLELIIEINELGTWGFESSATLSGFVLSVVWAIEFLMIIGFSIFFSTSDSFSKIPFCEETNQWLDEEELPAFPFIDDEDKDFVIKNLENGNETIFDEIQLSENSKHESHSTFVLYSPKKTGTSYLSIHNKHLNYDDKGKPQFNKKSVINYISINDTLKFELKEKKNAAPVFKS